MTLQFMLCLVRHLLVPDTVCFSDLEILKSSTWNKIINKLLFKYKVLKKLKSYNSTNKLINMFSSKINLFQLLMLTMVLEYVPGTGDSLMLLYDFNLYYRVKKSTKWICSRPKCNVSLTINHEETETELIFHIEIFFFNYVS